MKGFNDDSLKKLISLLKGDINKKQDTITATGILTRDESGTIDGIETETATLVDIPSGLLKGDGTTISAAVAGTDYLKTAPVSSVNNKTGAVSLTASDIGAAPAYTYSTTDLTAGTSTLATGKLYFVYE